MSRFGPNPRAFFEYAHRETPPWDIGGPQPAMAALFADNPPASPVLDVGCGSGDLAIALAQDGYQVLGIDVADNAIEQARGKVGALPTKVAQLLEFQVADALHSSHLHRQFGSIVDSGFYHLFDQETCGQFVDELVSALLPGGRYYLLAFAVEFHDYGSPRQISEDELRTCFSSEKGWQIRSLQSAEFQSRAAPVPAIGACIERISANRV